MKITFEGNALAHPDCPFRPQPASPVPTNLFHHPLQLSSVPVSVINTSQKSQSFFSPWSLNLSRPRTLSTSQWIRTMKVTTILLLAACLQVHAAAWSQTVSFTGKDVPLEQVFASVKKQTGFGFFYKAEILQNTRKVTLDVKNVSLEEFLDICLQNEPLSYKVVGQTVFITKKEEAHSASELAGGPGSELKGRITNTHGEPLVNANVIVKRTGRGAVTNSNGEFTLRSVGPQDIVTVSFVGYKTQSLALKGRSTLSLILDPATNDLDKVVVQAYGTTSQRLATGNIGVVRAEDIAKQPVMNVLQAIQGQVPGVVVTNTSGYASGAIKVEIRGRNTINDVPSDPLYIIDGVPLTIIDLQNRDAYITGSQGFIQSSISSPANGQSPFFSVNPSDIESIEVLKDADATAIYGSRGANGVILITTKKGKAGKTHADLNVYTGYSQTPRQYKMLNTRQYIGMRKEALKNDGFPVNSNYAPDLINWDTTRYTNWEKYLWGNIGKTTDIETSLSGGDPTTTFRIGAGYHHQTEILSYSGANQRGSVSFNINHKSANQRLNIILSGNYSIASINTIYLPGSITTPPDSPPIYDGKGNLNYLGWVPLTQNFPAAALLQPYNSSTRFLNSNLVLSYELLKGLIFRTNLGYNDLQGSQKYVHPIASLNPLSNVAAISNLGYTFNHNLIAEPQLEYNSFIGKGKLNLLLGASEQSATTSSVLLYGAGYTTDALISSISAAPSRQASNFSGSYKYEAIFGRVNYNWENKYILNLNARRDGSSRFGPGRQFGNFGSLGAAWIFSEEKIIKKDIPFLSFGKLRTSYGTTGGDQIGNYLYISQWAYGLDTYNGNLPLYPQGPTDSLLHWQVNKKLEASVNLGFLKDRITVEASWYRDRCNNQLVEFPTPVITGFSNVTTNSPANVQNAGWEFLITAKIVDDQDFKWAFKYNMGINRNKLLSYPNFSQSPFADTYVIGKSLYIAKKLHVTGVDPQTGLYTFEDKNKDGRITIDLTGKTTDDRYLVDLSSKFNGGVTNNFSYKNWQLSIFFIFNKQLGLNALSSTANFPGDMTNQPVNVLGRWQKPGDITNIARFTTNPASDSSFSLFKQYSDGIYSNASFIRLQNLSLSYTLSQKATRNLKISNLRFFIQGENLFIISKYPGLDPEVQSFATPPLARIVTTGISCNF
jgi:TonB-dependent starch-binding outer membrane protein SusC